MTVTGKWANRVKAVAPLMIWLYGLTLFILLFTVYLRLTTGFTLDKFTRDLASIAHLHPLFGFVSNIGALAWAAAATVCLLTAMVVRASRSASKRDWLFFALFGVLSLLLMADDLFQMHESFRDYWGFSEKATYAIYLLFTISLLVAFRQKILRSEYLLMLVAFGFFGLSMGIDIKQKLLVHYIPGFFLVEDGLKFIGIVTWLGYWLHSAQHILGVNSETD